MFVLWMACGRGYSNPIYFLFRVYRASLFHFLLVVNNFLVVNINFFVKFCSNYINFVKIIYNFVKKKHD